MSYALNFANERCKLRWHTKDNVSVALKNMEPTHLLKTKAFVSAGISPGRSINGFSSPYWQMMFSSELIYRNRLCNAFLNKVASTIKDPKARTKMSKTFNLFKNASKPQNYESRSQR